MKLVLSFNFLSPKYWRDTTWCLRYIKREKGEKSVYLRVLLFRNHDDSFLSQYCFSSPLVQILWTNFSTENRWVGGYLNSLPSKAPEVCLPLLSVPSRSLFVPAQHSHWGERRRRRRPRRGKQVPGCQSRTRPEQERTGLNRREQIPAGPPARRRPRAPLYIRHTLRGARARARAA